MKAEIAALLNCNSYLVEENGKLLATFLAGMYHSGDRYFVFEMNGMQYVVKKDGSFFKDEYQVINRISSEQIGRFQFGAEWFGKTTGTLTTDQTYIFKQRTAYQLIKPSTWKTNRFELSNQNVCIEYEGEYKQSAFSGIIDMSGRDKCLEAILGLFIIDERCRINQEKVP